MFLLTCSTGLSSCGAQASLERKLPLDRVKRITAKAATPHLIWVFIIRFLNCGSGSRFLVFAFGFLFLVFQTSNISDLKSQISNLRSQISDLRSQISYDSDFESLYLSILISEICNLRFEIFEI